MFFFFIGSRIIFRNFIENYRFKYGIYRVKCFIYIVLGVNGYFCFMGFWGIDVFCVFFSFVCCVFVVVFIIFMEKEMNFLSELFKFFSFYGFK